MILVVNQVVERYKTITLSPSCHPQVLPSERSMDTMIFHSKICMWGTQHHLQIALVNRNNPMSFNVQPHTPKNLMLLQPHLTYTLGSFGTYKGLGFRVLGLWFRVFPPNLSFYFVILKWPTPLPILEGSTSCGMFIFP